MKHAYMFVKYDYEGCSIGEKIYLSMEVAEQELAKEQENPNSEYYNHPRLECVWEVEEFELDDRK